MNIVVCVKHVPDAAGDRRFDPVDHTVDRAAADGLLSELDEYAVEQALSLVEGAGGEVTVVTVGPDAAVDALRKALQMGVDRAVHVLDDGIAGSDAPATSAVLAAAVSRLAFDLVVFGMASTDGGMGVVPGMVAQHLGLPALTHATDVRIGDGVVSVRRDTDAMTQQVEAAWPLVLSVTDQNPEPRYPSFKDIMAARKRPLETWSLTDLELGPGRAGTAAALTQVLGVQARPPRAVGEVVRDEGRGGAALAEFIVSRSLV